MSACGHTSHEKNTPTANKKGLSFENDIEKIAP
jgi:hypothetical protein